MNRIIKFLKTEYHLLFLLAFTLFFAWITRYLTLFGDDFYYATFVPSGFKFFVSENVTHYLYTNGRAWVHLLDELLLSSSGILAFKLFNTFAAAFIVVAVALSASKGDTFRRTLTAACVLFSLIGIQNAYQSVFWATGAINYMFPMLLSLLLFIVLQKGGRIRYIAPVLAFFASSSTEQAAFLALCTVIFCFIIDITKGKRPYKLFVVTAVLTAAGFILLFAAPGNSVRTGYYPEFYSMSLFERVRYNIPILRNLVFSKSGAGDVLLFYLISVPLRVISRKKATDIPFAAISFLGAAAYYGWLHLGLPSAFLHISALSTLVVLAADICLSLYRKELSRAFFVFMASVLQLAMLLSPEMGARTVLCSCILIMIPTAETAGECRISLSLPVFGALLFAVTLPGAVVSLLSLATAISAVLFTLNKKTVGYAGYIALVFLAIIMSDRMYTMVCGYRENYAVLEKNAANISEYKENGGDTLTIYYLPNPDFKYIMPYENEYHEYWFKRCYGINEETVIVYGRIK